MVAWRLCTQKLLSKIFYTNKFDTTAFTNFEAVPVPLSEQGGKLEHNGSRMRLMESRKQGYKHECEERMTAAHDKIPKYTTIRLKMPFD